MTTISNLSDKDWDNLLGLISDKNCTPFIGAGAASAVLPTGGCLAEAWAGLVASIAITSSAAERVRVPGPVVN